MQRPHAHRWWLAAALVAAAVFAFPAIDLTITSWFYDPARKMFHARSHPAFEVLRKGVPVVLFALAAGILVVWLAGEWRRRTFLGIGRRVAAFLLLSLALGPGLLVNVVLKEHWGRPRPSTIVEFGGTDTYVRPLILSDQCDTNCSFVSGHAALGFWTVSFAFLAPPGRRGRAFAATLAFGALMGGARIAQGGHFLSDVVFSAIITIGLAAWLHRSLVTRRDGTSPNGHLMEPDAR